MDHVVIIPGADELESGEFAPTFQFEIFHGPHVTVIPFSCSVEAKKATYNAAVAYAEAAAIQELRRRYPESTKYRVKKL